MSKLLTIIIPVYNVENYITQCLDSFIVPEILNDIEVLIINDGSPDQSAEIAQTYVDKYPLSFKLVSKENGGHGSTINLGIQLASGKYFKVVDGDDWIQKDALKELVLFLKNTDADLIHTNFYWVYEGTNKKQHEQKLPFAGVEYQKIYSFEDISNKCFIKMHNMTIRTSILKEHCPPLDENCFYVDNEYILYPVPYINTVVFLDNTVYMYRIGRSEQSINIKKMRERCKQHEYVLHTLLSFYSTKKDFISASANSYLANGIARMFCSQIKIYLSYPAEETYKKKIAESDLLLKQEYPEIYHAVKNKAVLLLRFSRYHLYKAGSYLFNILNSD